MATVRHISFIFIKLTFFFSFFTFSALNLVATYGLFDGLYLTALAWSVYVMCLPFSGGGVLFYPLAPIVGYLPTYAWELIAWTASIALNIATLVCRPELYEKTSVTHFMYWALKHPIPYWGLFLGSFLPAFTSLLHKKWHIPQRKLFFYPLQFLLISGAFIFLFYIAIQDIIILTNVHG